MGYVVVWELGVNTVMLGSHNLTSVKVILCLGFERTFLFVQLVVLYFYLAFEHGAILL